MEQEHEQKIVVRCINIGMEEMKGLDITMREAVDKDISNIIVFLKENITECIYMYIDIKKYGVTNPAMKVWIDEKPLTTVVMLYYESLQIYTIGEKIDIEWLKKILQNKEITTIKGRHDIICQIMQGEQPNYRLEDGEVYQIDYYREFEISNDIEHATPADAKEIAELICSEKKFAHNYDIKILARQLKDRMENSLGRNIIIRKHGQIVAHIATYAEYEDISVTSGLVVHPDLRKEGYGFMVESYLVNELLKEGKKVYTFILEEKRSALMKSMGATLCGKYGKLTKCSELGCVREASDGRGRC